MHWWYHNGNVVGNNEKVHASSSIRHLRFQIAAAFKKESLRSLSLSVGLLLINYIPSPH